MRNRRGMLLAIGVIGLVLAVVGAWVAWSFLRPRLDTIKLTAQFDSAAGLFTTNSVQVLGMKVGRVTKITPKTGYVEVDFVVDKQVKIPADAMAVTLSTSILTDRLVELTPPYRGGPALKDGDTIGLNRTRTPIEFARTLDMIDRLTTSMQGDGQGNGPLRTTVDSAALITQGNGEQIKSALDNLSRSLKLSSEGGVQTREQLTTSIKNLSSVMDAAYANDALLRDFGSTVRVLSQVIADEQLGTGTTGRQVNTVLTQLGEVLEDYRDEIKAVVANGNIAVGTMLDHQRDLAELLDLTPMTLDNMYNIVDQENGSARVRLISDKLLFESSTVKEICNMMGLRQLGCSTGTLQDFGPDWGLTYILDGLAAMGQK